MDDQVMKCLMVLPAVLDCDEDMTKYPYTVAGFIVPYKCYKLQRKELDRDKMRIRKGRLRLSPNEEAELLKQETEKRRRLRLQQVREQSKENAAQIRKAVKQEKHTQLMKLANDIKNQLESEKAERVRHLEQQYDNSLRNIGVGHKHANDQPDWSEERELVKQAENLRAEARGRSAGERHKRETQLRNQEANKGIVARRSALETERERAREVAAMPPPPPDPLENIQALKTMPVKVTDMNAFSTSHYHLQNEHAVDRASPEEEQPNAREAAEVEQERIADRALELRRLRQDQLERARLRHNQALEKELLKHDYNNILHDLSDLQRADRERRLKVVHHIPKQVFEPPNFRMEDREDRQRNMEQDFEDMYMAGTDHQGDLSMAFEPPQPRPLTPTREDSLDVTATDMGLTPLQEPSLPAMPPVLRDMTNMPQPKSPGKKPEKVLRGLMDRIKSQREEWMTSHSMIDVGDGSQQINGYHVPMDTADTSGVDMSQFQPLIPDTSPAPVQSLPTTGHSRAPPTYFQPGYPLATVSQPTYAQPTVSQNGYAPPTSSQGYGPPTSSQGYAPPSSSQGYAPPTSGQNGYAPPFVSQNGYAPPTSSQTAFALPPASQAGYAPPPVAPGPDRMMAMPRNEFSENLRMTNEKQQTNVQLQPSLGVQQAELLQIMQQQDAILEQKRQLELKLQQLTHEQQKLQLTNQAPQHQPPHGQSMPGATDAQQGPQIQTTAAVSQQHMPPNFQTSQGQPGAFPQQYTVAGYPSQPVKTQASQMMPQPTSQGPVMNGLPPPSMHLQQQFASSLSSSGMSQQPMNSIPPTNGTTTLPIATTVGQQHYPGHSVRSAYQPPSAVLTTDQLYVPGYGQQQPTSQPQYHPGSIPMATTAPPVSMTTQEVPYPDTVSPSSLTEDIHSDQMRKVKEYQQHLLARHEQSKHVLEETKAEIKRRRENLLERYPKLDLSRLENLGAKYLENGTQPLPQAGNQAAPVVNGHPVSQSHPAFQGQLPSQGQGQATDPGQAASISALLATLASHPYYKATLSLPDVSQQQATMPQRATTVTVASVHQAPAPAFHPDMNMDTNLRKNKLDNIRKSLPFDHDESFQTPIRVYEAYAQKDLDTTSATEMTDGDTSTLTSKGSPSLPSSSRQGQQYRPALEEESYTEGESTDMDTTVSQSPMSDRDECLTRQDELRHQLADIQRQKEEIMKRTELGQLKLLRQEGELKAKLASISPEELAQQLTEGIRNRERQLTKPSSVQKEFVDQPSRPQQFNLSTIPEVDTPISTRPSDSGRLSDSSSEGGSHSLPGRRSTGMGPVRSEVIPEESGLEDVETQMETDARRKSKVETVADYSGKNITDVLERAKRFESEVLEKLRRQTNAVLFDNEFDDSLEFNVSRRQVSADSLSTGSLSNSSLSTGPLEDSSISKPNDSADLRSANGSFKTTGQKSWASELSQYMMPAADQSDPSFKVMKPESNQSSLEHTTPNGDTLFVDEKNRFKVYANINQAQSPEDLSLGKINGEDINAQDVIKLLREMQKEFRTGEEARQMLVKTLVEQQNVSIQSKREPSPSFESSGQVSRPFMSEDSKEDSVSRPFMSDHSKSEMSQYSFSDKSTDVSLGQPSPADKSRQSPIESGTSSKEKAVPIRRSPIGDNARTVSPSSVTRKQNSSHPDTSGTEYSFAMTSGSQRSTSTPGEDEQRRKSVLDAHSTTARSELPSEITVGERSNRQSVKFQDFDSTASSNVSNFKQLKPVSKSPGDGLDWSSSRDDVTSSQFDTLSTDTKGTSGDLTTYSVTSAEESLQSIKKEFSKLKPKGQAPEKIKTYAVSRSGELISEHSDSDHTQRTSMTPSEDLTTFSLSRESVDTKNKSSVTGLSSYSINNDSSGDKTGSTLSQYMLTSSVPSDASDSNLKSSSLTTVTSDQSLNGTGASMFMSMKESVSSSIDDSGNNFIQQRFASLDNLISESKNLIERHKTIIDKNKQPETVPSQQVRKAGEREINTKTSVANSFPKPFYTSANINESSNASTDTDLTRISSAGTDQSRTDVSAKSLSFDRSKNQSATQDKSLDQSSSMDCNSLDYLTEHSSGILEEPMPDLRTVGSEVSISEAFHKTEDLSDSGDSLVSFEKHEMSETSQSAYEDDSTQDQSKSDSLQEIMEARRHNFMVQSERRAAAAKERALARSTADDGQLFRAVPVNVVAMPTLSMSVSSGSAEKVKAKPESQTVTTKSAPSFSDKKTAFENKGKENTMTVSQQKALNRALQPRTPDSPQPKDSGMQPTFKFDQIRNQRSSSAEEKPGLGKLAGEIRQFGGSTGLYQKAASPSPKKTPPKVLPKPVRGKPQAPSQPQGPVPGATGLSKTLSSWKKSRAITSKPTVTAAPASNRDAPKGSIRVLPQEAPAPLTEEERQQKAEDEVYEKNIRAYNPRLFRLQHKLDTTTDDTDTQSEKNAGKKETRKEPESGQQIRMSQFSSRNKRLMAYIES